MIKQDQLVQLIIDSWLTHGRPPSYQQIADALGYASTNSVAALIDTLLADGRLIRPESGSNARNLRVPGLLVAIPHNIAQNRSLREFDLIVATGEVPETAVWADILQLKDAGRAVFLVGHGARFAPFPVDGVPWLLRERPYEAIHAARYQVGMIAMEQIVVVTGEYDYKLAGMGMGTAVVSIGEQ